jgi:serine O-acetyltransferase
MKHIKFIDSILIFLFNPAYQILKIYRISFYLNNHKIPLLVLILRWWSYILYSCEISFSAIIGKNFKLPHPIGIVIGAGVIIKNNVTIFQNVTLGGKGGNNEKGYPIIEDGVVIYAGAKIIGNIRIGKNAIIGANSVVMNDVPAETLAVGVPAKIIIRIKK